MEPNHALRSHLTTRASGLARGVLFGVLCSVSVGCGDDGPSGPDAGADAALDTASDTASDTAADAAFDAAEDTGPDVVTDGGSDAAVDAPDGGIDVIADTAPDATDDPRYRNRIVTDADFEALADGGRTVKFLVPQAGAEVVPPLVDACYFQNMALFAWHLDFIRSFTGLEALSAVEYERWSNVSGSRRWWTGALQRYPNVLHPASETLGLTTFEAYATSELGAGLSLEPFIAFAGTLATCAPALASELAFLPTTDAQIDWAETFESELNDAGITVVYPEDLVGARGLEVLAEGVAYGELVVVDSHHLPSDLGAGHILVTRFAESDLTAVGGLVTESPQNPFSHLNLRMGDRGSPNVSTPDAFTLFTGDAPWAELEGELVRMRAYDDELEIVAATLEEAQAHWDATRPNLPPPEFDLGPTALAPFSELGIDDAPAYGSKAANLAELWHVLPAQNRTEGFAIPISRYAEFMEATGIQDDVDALLDGPPLSGEHLDDALDDIRDDIRDAELDPEFLDEVRAQIVALVGAEAAETTRIRFRSSSNVEDLADWSGAGLYDSRSGCLGDTDPDAPGPSACRSALELSAMAAQLEAAELELEEFPEREWLEDIIEDLEEDMTERRTVQDAILKVWRSLWSLRAFQEREYWGVDHRRAFMGISVNVSFALEQRNAVAVTNVARTDGTRTDRMLSQFGEESVVDPDNPNALPEVLNMVHDLSTEGGFTSTVVAQSTLAPDARPLWTVAQQRELAVLFRLVHQHFAAAWPADSGPACFDMEIKLEADGRITIKQVRPYSGCAAELP